MRGSDSVGKRIVELRKSLGLTQTQFAKDIKISRPYVGTLEQGLQPTNERLINIICMTYNINVNWLRDGKGPIRNKIVDKQLEKVMADFKKLDVLFQEYIVKQIEWLNGIQEKQGAKK